MKIVTVEITNGDFDFFIEYPDDLSYTLRVGWSNGIPYLYSFDFTGIYYPCAAVKRSECV